MRLLILGCSATKRPDTGLLPAINRYDGPAWQVLRKFLREHPDWAGALDILVVSAEFGLLAADHPISDYDRRMDARRAIELHPQLRGQLRALLAGRPAYAATCINLGQTYSVALSWADVSAMLSAMFGGPQRFGTVTHAAGGIGQRLGQLKHWLEAIDG